MTVNEITESTKPKAKRDILENPELTKAIKKIEKNRALRFAQATIWGLEGILTREEVLKITGFLQAKKEGIV